MTPNIILWLALAIVLAVVEASTFNLVSIWFAVGAVGGLAASWLGAGFTVQLAVFAVVSLITLVATRPLVGRLKPRDTVGTSADSNLGRTGLVIAPIRPDQPGRVRVDGVDWRAESALPLEEGELCRVIAVGATTLTVEPQHAAAT
ncbi:MAG: NfeD family protein [Oscillospiraceae bacterium]|nr:NfeD family protein [Oscillospiraceae bacterium]